MGWAAHAIERLLAGKIATIRPRGHSVRGRVDDGDVVTVSPCGSDEPKVDDVVLVKIHGHEYLHLVKAHQDARYQIGNNRGGINGWVGRGAIFGRATRIESTAEHARRKQTGK